MPDPTHPDVYIPLSSLAIKVIGTTLSVIFIAHVAIMKRVFSNIDKCNESHPSNELFKSELGHLKEGQERIFRILDSRKGTDTSNKERRRSED